VKPIGVAAVVTAAVTVSASMLSACTGGLGGTGGSGGSRTVVVATDLPLQGASKDASDATNQAIELYLAQHGNKAGDYTVQLKKYDNSTAAKGAWDDAMCAKNAHDHVANPSEVAVMGPYNSGCAKIEVPVLNAAGMLMVSHSNTNPGLTKTWEANEPAKYYPSGRRSYARVVTTDDYQGTAAATFASEKIGSTRVYVLNDNQTYGQGLAKAFATAATRLGMTVLGNEAWDKNQPTYTALFTKIKALSPDLVYVAGIYDNNGGQLVKDKVAVLGDNSTVKLMGPDGFTGYPSLDKLPAGQGMYLTFAGLSTNQLQTGGGAAAALLRDYKAKYGSDPASAYALYGVAAVQVILAAIARSDGTRQGVMDQVFTGSGVDIAAGTSVIGKEITIDPATGDTSNKDISVLQLEDDQETFIQAQPV
jgi:branched-chain amino acid transport system substrate-binding protein